MKYFKIIAILLVSSVISFYSCDDNPNSKVKEIPQGQEVSNSSVPPSSETPAANNSTTAQNASGVYHYTCSNGCEGGAGSAVNCANCGLLLKHNTAYHSSNNSSNTNTPTPLLDASTTNAATNTAGVFHYTCPKGCAGGGGSAGACATCGTTLAHNPAYH